MSEPKDKLTPKQARFVEQYLVDLNATQAAIRAGYSAKTAGPAASRLLAHVKIAAAIAAGKDSLSVKTGITAERVLAELEGMAFARLEHFEVDAAGNVAPKAGAPAHVSAGLLSIKRREWSDGEGGHTVEVEWKINGKFEPVRLAGKYARVPGFADRPEDKEDKKPTDIQVHTGLPPDDEELPPGAASA